ncbi:MAG: hypothetical protein GY822_06370 [Deltaproteobacteria bacterium]|nr:hypothetical protein [Deltaproteobacteria bacterium]
MRATIVLSLFVSFLFLHLGSGCAPTSTNSCVTGETIRCVCQEGDGVQVCLDDGTYGECVCGDVEPSVTPDDAGQSNPDDAGQSNPDAGQSNPDAGSDEDDSGVSLMDAGLSPSDGGSPPVVITPGSGHRIARGDRVSCWIDPEDHILCFGSDVRNRASAPEGLYGAISMGDFFGCGLNRSGRIQCWGDNAEGQQQSPTGIFTHVAAGARHACALREDSSAECWGDSSNGQLNAPPLSFVAISAGPEHTCGLLAEGAAVCWGQNIGRQSSAPNDELFTQLALSEHTSCGLKLDGEIFCWGVEDEATTHPPSGQFTALSAGEDYFCALDNEERVVCWGAIGGGAPSGRFTALASGPSSTCAYQSNGIRRCFGANGSNPDIPLESNNVKKMLLTSEHACLLTNNLDLLCVPRDGVVGVSDLSQQGPFMHLDLDTGMACASKNGLDFNCFGEREVAHQFTTLISALAIDRGDHRSVVIQDQTDLFLLDELDEFTAISPSAGVVFNELKMQNGVICGLADGNVHRYDVAGDGDWTQLYESGDVVEVEISDEDKCCWLDTDGVVTCQHLSNPFAFDEDFKSVAMHRASLNGFALDRELGTVVGLDDGESLSLAPGIYDEIDSIPSLTCAVHELGNALCWGQENMRFE